MRYFVRALYDRCVGFYIRVWGLMLEHAVVTKAVHFTELAVRKAVSAARKSGLDVNAISIAPDGTITIQQAAKTPEAPLSDPEADNWSNV